MTTQAAVPASPAANIDQWVFRIAGLFVLVSLLARLRMPEQPVIDPVDSD